MKKEDSKTLCFFGFDEKDEGGRSWAVRTGLVGNGFIVKSCRTIVDGFLPKYLDLIRKWRKIDGRIDVIYVIFMGYYLMPLAWCLARWRNIPVILDALVSQYDTEVFDRKRISRFNPRAWFLWLIDFLSCFFSDAIVVDTFEHGKFFMKKFYVNKGKIIIVPVGCRSDLFIPLDQPKEKIDNFIVEFHGSFIPLQGIEYIIKAAKILNDKKEKIIFEITGSGQTFSTIIKMTKELCLSNVKFLGRKRLQELPHSIARGDICLGIFGTTEKAMRVIPNKVYECLSCGKAVITEYSPAILELLKDHEDLCLIPPGNGVALAEKILELRNNIEFRVNLGKHARMISLDRFSPNIIVVNLVNWIKSQK